LERSACILGLIIVGGSPARSVAPHVALVNYRKCPGAGEAQWAGARDPTLRPALLHRCVRP
jgi:hypothetical protein